VNIEEGGGRGGVRKPPHLDRGGQPVRGFEQALPYGGVGAVAQQRVEHPRLRAEHHVPADVGPGRLRQV